MLTISKVLANSQQFAIHCCQIWTALRNNIISSKTRNISEMQNTEHTRECNGI
ncbi:hypothetical protein T4B_12361 [Trichinella pseudospiralis]|uniref:Uncharacterized protein n=1 Tax=Trichinella pseudospiralis TaxID=6337 RepID=A0A0V1H2V6_TRIPS|nr:hypothetical protein T4B_12361 [Trichinella pseudospiralis]